MVSEKINDEEKNSKNGHLSDGDDNQNPDGLRRSFLKSGTLNQFFSEPRNKLQKYGDIHEEHSIHLSESIYNEINIILEDIAKFMIILYKNDELELSDGIYEGN